MPEVSWVIYGLAAPGCGEIRYVGLSKDVSRRYREHRSVRKLPRLAPWLDELSARGEKPRVIILRYVRDGEDPKEIERQVIQSQIEDGHRLLNQVKRPASPALCIAAIRSRGATTGHAMIAAILQDCGCSDLALRSGVAAVQLKRFAKGAGSPNYASARKLVPFGVPMQAWPKHSHLAQLLGAA